MQNQPAYAAGGSLPAPDPPSNRFIFDPSMLDQFKKQVKVLNAEWGTELHLFHSVDQFKECMEHNFKRTKKGGVILLRDLQNLLKRKFNLKTEDGKMIRFLDQNELKIVT